MITTVAGNGDSWTIGYGILGEYGGDGGPATAAELNLPSDIAVDAAGDLFIADTSNMVIREVNHATGVITTVAGNGSQYLGYTGGDGGPATAATAGDTLRRRGGCRGGPLRFREPQRRPWYSPRGRERGDYGVGRRRHDLGDRSINPSVYGQPVTFTATVTATQPGAGTPTGTVTFIDDGTLLGSGILDANGNATFSTDTVPADTHTITAFYAGDAEFTASIGSVAQTVNQDTTTTVVSASANPAVYGQPVTFTATVAAATQPGYRHADRDCDLPRRRHIAGHRHPGRQRQCHFQH